MTTDLGKVYLVGAGPGDPGLITVKGRDCIAAADVIIYDYLAAPVLLNAAREGAERIYVGKKGGDHTLSQDGINDLIVEKARNGRVVARLKGGDPFIFGRGGEEAEVLREHGIPFEIVPGVTSAIAAPAYAGIPLTHRAFTSTLAFVTGHEDPEKETSGIDWAALARGVGTLVFFMGVKNLPRIRTRLMENGMDPTTPAAVVRWGTTSRQETVTGTLSDIAEQVEAAGIKAPAIIVVGEVVRLRQTLGWFEDRPLLGQQVVVTRARHQASDLVTRLTDLGADCLECPTIQVAPPDRWDPVDRAIDHLADYNWIVFTSVNGVRFFFRRLHENGRDVRALHTVKTAVIGPATRDRLAREGLGSDIVPDSFRAESVAAAFAKEPMTGRRVLLPRAGEARPVLPQALREMGATVDEVTAYVTRQDRTNADTLVTQLRAGRVAAVTFTSSSTVKNFKALLPADEEMEGLMAGVVVASIGPITSETARDLGFTVHIEADTYTIPGLCEAIARHFQG